MKNFSQRVSDINQQFLHFDTLKILQVNVGNLCNQSCEHCHVNAGPGGTHIMGPEVMDRIQQFAERHRELTVDITGGAPEMNPFFRRFADSLHGRVNRLMVRTNLTVFFEAGREDLPQWYAERGIVLVASMPCYLKENVDGQRGGGVYDKSIRALQMLNALGYGTGGRLELDLVYNPGTDVLPASQADLEAAYKRELKEKYGIVFDRLFTITNAPVGRFLTWLQQHGKLGAYQRLLEENFTPETAEQIMCRQLVSVDWRGVLYNCDFNQALDRPIIDRQGRPATIDCLEELLARGFRIITDSHCFCCTAGAGSSCTGSLIKKD